MAGRCTTFPEDAWAKELVLVASFAIGGLAVILPPLSPFTKYSTIINKAMPRTTQCPSVIMGTHPTPCAQRPPGPPGEAAVVEETVNTSRDREEAPSPVAKKM